MTQTRVSRRVLAAMALVGGIALAVGAKNDMTVSPAVTEVKLVAASGVHRVRVEVARSEEERLQGLMERTALDENGGMLFVYRQPQPVRAGFWMYRTRIPLDIAFLDQRGIVLAIHTMPPCASPEPLRCPSYNSPTPYQFALEVNSGYFLRHGITVGDRAEFVLPDTR